MLKKKTDVKKTIIVQLVYVLRQANHKKAKNLISQYSIEIKSLNGLVNYRVQGIKHGGKTIIFFIWIKSICCGFNKIIILNRFYNFFNAGMGFCY